MSYIALANITLSSAQSSVTFGSIPNTYRDLVLVADGTTSVNTDFGIRFNSDTGNNYSYVLMRGYSSTAESSALTFDRIYWSQSSVTAGSRFAGTANIMDYAQTDKHKTVLTRSNYTGSLGSFVEAKANRWPNTNAITSITILTGSGNFTSGSTFALYGIAG